MTISLRRVPVALKRSTKVPDLLVQAEAIVQAMSGNSWFSRPCLPWLLSRRRSTGSGRQRRRRFRCSAARRDAEITRKLDELFADARLKKAQRRSAAALDEAGTDWSDERW